jgi:hypothetical protein
MASRGERKSWSKPLALAILLASVSWGCVIGRVYIGSEIKDDQRDKIVVGTTSKSEILAMYGPPDSVRRQYDGDVFMYQYVRRNSAELDLTEPVVTRMTVFSFTRLQQKADSLMILFDGNGIVKGYGFRRGTAELESF